MHRSPPPVPDYVVGSRLGEGAYGVVHQAVHLVSGTRVALKRVRITKPRMQVALETEVLAMARLNHPHVLSVYDYGVLGPDDGRWMWMAVELASGGALTDWHPSSWGEVEPVLSEVLAGLAHAHARGMVHRDLKPANLLRSAPHDHRPGLKIGDFGLAMVRGVEQAIRRGGTPLYMPPEQSEPGFGPLGPWTDLYALGAVLWEWCTGAPPFEGAPLQVLGKHLGEELPAFRPRFALPEAVEPLLRRMLEKEPADRPDAVAAVQHALGWVPTSVPAALSQASAARSSARLPGIGLGLLPLRDARLVGRHTERQVLTEALESAVMAWRPEVVLIHGPAGVGKTRLMRWIAETAAEAGVARIAWQPSDVDRALKMAWRGPVVACFDALDVEGEALVSALAFAGAPVLVVATTRHPTAWPQLAELPRFRRLGLAPMQPTPFRTFLHGELGLSEELTVRMDERCGFVPGVASTWMQRLAQQGRLVPRIGDSKHSWSVPGQPRFSQGPPQWRLPPDAASSVTSLRALPCPEWGLAPGSTRTSARQPAPIARGFPSTPPYGGPRADRRNPSRMRTVAGAQGTARSTIRPPHRGHRHPPSPKTCHSSHAHVRYRVRPRFGDADSASVSGSASSPSGACGTTSRRHADRPASTPWYST